jgi:uncharacterized protein YbjT (DUF2867 family)
MKTVAIIGASGLVGGRVLTHLLDRDDVGQVVALGRRELPLQHERLTAKVVDLQSIPAMAAELPDDITSAVSCLGTTMRKAGSKAAFRGVDRDAVVAFAQAALTRGARRFALVSSVGADASSRSFYLRTKGETEKALAALGFAELVVLRPSLIDDQGARAEHRPSERFVLPFARALFGLLGKTSRYAPVTADTIARALVRLACAEDGERVRVVESEALHELGT